MNFWKAGSQSPITSPSSVSVTKHRRQHFIQFLAHIWKYVKWPLALLTVCIIVGALVYFLLVQNEMINDHDENSQHLSIGTSATFGDDDYLQQEERTAINFLHHYNSINRNTSPSSKLKNDENNNRTIITPTVSVSRPTQLYIFNGKKSIENNKDIVSTTTSKPAIKMPTKTAPTQTVLIKSAPKILLSPITTTFIPSVSTDTKNVKAVVYSNSGDTRKLPQSPRHTTLLLNINDDQEENIVDRSKLLFPTKETLEIFGFTSGHQNNFGIPIEEDERILRMLNEQMLMSQRKANKSVDYFMGSTTDSNIYRTKVSPTLPILQKNDATTERIRYNVTDDGEFFVIFKCIL